MREDRYGEDGIPARGDCFEAVRDWITAVGAQSAHIVPGLPWENADRESFNARFGDELPNGETFHALEEARIVIERWRKHDNTVRPRGALGHRPSAPETISPLNRGHQRTNNLSGPLRRS